MDAASTPPSTQLLTFLSSSAWFCSARVRVVATVSMSTVSHKRRSQILCSVHVYVLGL
jgi:hypothetical protein